MIAHLCAAATAAHPDGLFFSLSLSFFLKSKFAELSGNSNCSVLCPRPTAPPPPPPLLLFPFVLFVRASHCAAITPPPMPAAVVVAAVVVATMALLLPETTATPLTQTKGK